MVELPEGYNFFVRNYEKKPAAGSASGPSSRKDIHVFGHPKSIRLSYRTPKEFGPHLLWLLSDSQDRKDCSCLICNPAPPKKAKAPVPPKPLPVGAGDKAVPPLAAASQSPIPVPAKTAQASQAAPPATGAAESTHQMQSTTRPAPTGTTGVMITGNTEVFRSGELVWYVSGSAWRLGVVWSVDTSHANKVHHKCIIAPINHACFRAASVEKQFSGMRPFLSFSVPAVSIPDLLPKTYNDVDWPSLVEAYRADPSKNPEVVGLEASKMAANMINASFSLFNKRQSIGPDRSIYGGVFLGAEQIRVGDALRIQKSVRPEEPGVEVMFVNTIFNTTEAGANGTSLDHVSFVGSVYILESTANGQAPPLRPAAEQPHSQIFVDEVAVRDSITAGLGRRWYWRLVQKDAVRKEADIFGRYYLTDKLMGILDPQGYRDRVAQGVVSDGQAHLNKRMQASDARYFGRRANRQATLGACVGVQLKLGEGIVEEPAS